MLDETLELQLIAARRGCPAGSVQDLHRKHLLALILRQDPKSCDYTPRSYLLPPKQGPYTSEYESFKRDFALSFSLALLAHFCKRGHDSDQQLRHAFQRCTQLLAMPGHLGASATEATEAIDAIASLTETELLKDAESLLSRMQGSAAQLQLKINEKNWWLLKPVDGAVGKGIVLFGGLDSEILPNITNEMFTGRASDGYILQKYVEKPHLLDVTQLLQAEQQLRPSSEGSKLPATPSMTPELYKYNLRHWVLIHWTGTDPPVWLYEKGYIELCSRPFTTSLDNGSHIANLSEQSQSKSSSGVTRLAKRMWSTDALAEYLRQMVGSDVWNSQILPQIRQVVARTVAYTCPLRTGEGEGKDTKDTMTSVTESSKRCTWRRFGFDFTLDDQFHVWLIEVNHKPGMKSPKGWQGDAKRCLLAEFYADERELCGESLQETRIGSFQPIGGFSRVTLVDKLGRRTPSS